MWNQTDDSMDDAMMHQTPPSAEPIGAEDDNTSLAAGRRTGSASKRVVKKPKRDLDEGFVEFNVTGVASHPSNGAADRKRCRSVAAGEDNEEDQGPISFRSLADDEAKFRPGTKKYICFQLLKEAGSDGLSLTQLLEAARQAEAAGDWSDTDNSRRVLQFALANDQAFTRVNKGVYTLSALASPDGKYAVPTRKSVPNKGQRGPRREKDAGFEPVYRNDLEWLDFWLGLANDNEYGNSLIVRDYMHDEGGNAGNGCLLNGFQADEAVERIKEELSTHLLRQDLAARKVQDYKAQVKAWDMQNRAPPPRKKDEEFPDMPKFEVPLHLREYSGDPDDSKALRAHRKQLQALTQKVEREKREWIEEQRAARKKAQSNINKGGAGLRKQLKEAEKAYDLATRLVGAAQQALALAEKNLSKECGKKGAAARRAREREDKEAARMAHREDRERRRAEEASIRRYPIEDLELLEEKLAKAEQEGTEPPLMDVPELEPLDSSEGCKLFVSLYIADFITQFSKTLGMPPLSYKALEGMLAIPEQSDAALRHKASLFGLYQGLLRFIFWKSTARLEKRWQAGLAGGTWPEVLRRYVLTRTTKGLVDPDVKHSAALLGCEGVGALGHDAHRNLLHYLCDEALDREGLRDALQNRADAADGSKKDRHGNLWEDVNNLAELQKVGRETEKIWKSEARSEEDLWGTEINGDVAVTANDLEVLKENGHATMYVALEVHSPPSPGDVGRGRGDAATGYGNANGIAVASEDADGTEAYMEAPPDLEVFRGDPDDAAASREVSHNTHQDLLEAQPTWESGQNGGAADVNIDEKAALENGEERSRRQAEEDAIVLRQEQLERQQGRFAVRHNPLGLDRNYRKYWWGLGGERDVLYVEDGERIAPISSAAELNALLATLDRCGTRESALALEIEQAQPAIMVAMRRAQVMGRKRARESSQEKGIDVSRQVKRERLYPPGVAGSCSLSRESSPPLAHRLPEEEALDKVLTAFAAIQNAAVATAVDCPVGGWKAFEAAIQEAGRNALPPPGCPKGSEQKQALEVLKAKLLEVEERVHSVARPTGEEDEDADVNDEPTFKKLRGRAASKAKALAAAAAKAAAAARRENMARRSQQEQDGEEGSLHEAATSSQQHGLEHTASAVSITGDEDGQNGVAMLGDDEDADDDDNDARDDDGDDEDVGDGDEERKSQFGDHEDGAGDLTRQSSGAAEDPDGLPSAALRVLEHVEDGPDKRRSGRLWRSAKERWVWRKDATMILNLTWLAYSTTVLEANALPVLKYVKRNIDRAAANRAAAASKVKPTEEELAAEQAARLAQAYTAREKRAKAKKWDEDHKKRGHKRREPSDDDDPYRKPRRPDGGRNRTTSRRRG